MADAAFIQQAHGHGCLAGLMDEIMEVDGTKRALSSCVLALIVDVSRNAEKFGLVAFALKS